MRIIRALPGHALLILWTLIVILPFVLISLLAFRPDHAIFAYPLGIGGDFTLDNFVDAWIGPAGGTGLSSYLLNSVVIGVTALATNLVIGSPAAFFSVRLPRRMRDAFLVFLLVVTVVPHVLLVIPLFQVFDSMSLTNSPAALGIAYGIISMPTTILILHAFYRDFPNELVEAASMDGLGLARVFVSVVLPLSKGAIVGVSILALIFVWGEAQIGITILQNRDTQSVPIGLLGFRGQFTVLLGPIFAGLAIASIPIIAVYLLLNKYITKGIALGGVIR
jgi:raffinose/stachyose/melibiose transport system permease protein